jgi:hypothetical protein
MTKQELSDIAADARLRNATREEIRGITHAVNGGKFIDGQSNDWMMGFMEGMRIMKDE